MENIKLIHIIFLIIAVILEIGANIFLKLSNGFKNFIMGTCSIVAILVSFLCLSMSIDKGSGYGFNLTIAYALWGSIGITITVITGFILFKQKLNVKGVLGLILIIIGIIILS